MFPMKFPSFVCLVALFSGALCPSNLGAQTAPAPAIWALRCGGEGNDKIRGISAAPDGGVFVTGELSGTADFGSHSLVSEGNLDFVVAKIGADGKVLWASRAGGDAIDRGYGVSPAPDGGCYVTGHFQSATIQFGDTLLTNSGDYDWFIARYDAKGACLWARSAGGMAYDYGHGMATDADGNAVVAGSFAGSGTIGGETIGETAGRSAILAKYSPDGNLLWARASGGTGSNSGNNVCVNPQTGDIHLCGHVQGQTSFGEIKLERCQVQEPFVATFDGSGKVKWVRLLGGACAGLATGVAADEQGQIYLSGMGKGTFRAGKDEETSRGDYDFFAAAFSSSGKALWVHTGGGAGVDYGLGIASRPGGGCALTGEIAQQSEFAGHPLAAIGERDAIVISLQPDGRIATASVLGGKDHDLSYAITSISDGTLVIAGAFRNTTTFGNTTLTTSGKGNDIFIAKVKP